ncbi:MAG: protoporphyrinogen oxidase HemJ, partial [Cyanobacteriota bacterium]|nr:protoporphyrinogen oxidase HemJ [Cyanobacteriota bacterium]
YHAEAAEKPDPARSILTQQYELMEKRLYHIITNPGMFVTVAMAIALVWTEPAVLHDWWLHAKLFFVLLLIGYHHYCKRLMKKLAAGECQWSGQQFRALNEAPTVLLVVIVLLATFKNSLPLNWTTGAIAAMVVAMAAAIQLYAKKRRLDSERQAAEQSQTQAFS